jgi:hypothetical protein
VTDLVVIVPSRGRPQAMNRIAQAFLNTCTANTLLTFAVDADDQDTLGATLAHTRQVDLCVSDSSSMVQALNFAATGVAGIREATATTLGWRGSSTPFAIGFMGDDHRPRTVGWDARYLEALRELGTGIVYGNDLLQGERIPTQCAMTADIVRALGFMAPPVLTHLYVDNYWKTLGQRADCLRYLPDVVVEHLHPVAGKAAWDDGYRRVNAPEMYSADQRAFEAYAADGLLSADVAKVRALRSVTA